MFSGVVENGSHLVSRRNAWWISSGTVDAPPQWPISFDWTSCCDLSSKIFSSKLHLFLWMHFDGMHSSEHKKVVNVLEYECALCHRTYYEHDWNSIPYFKLNVLEECTHSVHVGWLHQRCHMKVVNALEYACAFKHRTFYEHDWNYIRPLTFIWENSVGRMNAFGTRRRTWPALPPCLHFFECELHKLGGMVIEHSLLHI